MTLSPSRDFCMRYPLPAHGQDAEGRNVLLASFASPLVTASHWIISHIECSASNNSHYRSYF